jgi:hypothetical protein
MSTETKCGNCGKPISVPGHVHYAFFPALVVVLAFLPPKLCEPCATGINVVGFILTLMFVVGLLVWVLAKWSA